MVDLHVERSEKSMCFSLRTVFDFYFLPLGIYRLRYIPGKVLGLCPTHSWGLKAAYLVLHLSKAGMAEGGTRIVAIDRNLTY